jgi:hypothetical protein
MAAYEYAFTLNPRGTHKARSFAIAGAAIAAVCVLSSTVVMRELIGAAPAQATIAQVPPATVTPTPAAVTPVISAQTWALEPRWWPGTIRQAGLPAPTVLDSDLTFAKGYAQRVAARQAVLTAHVASSEPASESLAGRKAIVHKPTMVASTALNSNTNTNTNTATAHRAPAPRVDTASDRAGRYDLGGRTLAYDEPRPSRHGELFGSLFGNLN